MIGAVLACGASCFYDLGIILQADEARASDDDAALRPWLLKRLATRPRWLAGTALTVLGWPLQALALRFAPLAVVQPALAFGLVPLVVLGSRRLGLRVGRAGRLATAGIVAGVAALAAVAPADSGSAGGASAAVALGALGLAATVPYAARHRAGSAGAALGAGLALAWSGLSTRYVADALAPLDVAALLRWSAATALASGVGLLSEMTALQRAPETRVAPAVFAVQVAVPVALGPLVTGDRWGHDAASWLVTAAAMLLVVGSAAALLRGGVLASTSADTGTDRRPRTDSARVTATISAVATPGDGATSTRTTSPASSAGSA